MWWWTFHRGSLWKHLENKERHFSRSVVLQRDLIQVQTPTFWVQQFSDTEFLLCHVEGVLEVVGWVGSPQSLVVHQIRPERQNTTDEKRLWAGMERLLHLLLPMFVYESVEGHAVFPAGREVCDVDVGITTTQPQERKTECYYFSVWTKMCSAELFT